MSAIGKIIEQYDTLNEMISHQEKKLTSQKVTTTQVHKL